VVGVDRAPTSDKPTTNQLQFDLAFVLPLKGFVQRVSIRTLQPHIVCRSLNLESWYRRKTGNKIMNQQKRKI